MKYKRNLIILLISLLLYIGFTIIYNNIIVKSKELSIYILKENIKKGEYIDESKLERINVLSSLEKDYISDINVLKGKVASLDLYKSQIVTKNMIIEKDKLILATKDKELVSLKIGGSEDVVSYEVKRNSLVNVYYTGKLESAQQIIKDLNSNNVISGGTPNYVTIGLLKNIKVIGVYDTFGNELSDDINKTKETIIDTLIIEVDSNTAMMIKNLQKYGNFSISLIS